MNRIQRLKKDYPWIQTPLVVGAPMRLIALAEMAVEVTKAGGIGFIGAGTDISDLPTHLAHAQGLFNPSHSPNSTLPIGIGFINWGASITDSIPLIARYRPAAVWFFAPSSPASLVEWTQMTRQASPATKVWVQIGSVTEAIDVVKSVKPDVLVVQGTDAGGHGLAQGAGLIALLPEVCDAVNTLLRDGGLGNDYAGPTIIAAGGIADTRGASAALMLGASGVVLGTRLLASPEAKISKGYQAEVLRSSDGGQTTVRTKVYDDLRGTTGWAESHNARGVINKSYTDSLAGMDGEENKRLYEEEVKKGDVGWGEKGRMTTYAGSAVGLVREVKSTGEIVNEIREGTRRMLNTAKARL